MMKTKAPKSWPALRIIAGLQAALALVVSTGSFLFWIFHLATELIPWPWATNQERFLGAIYLLVGLVGSLLLWAALRASAEFIRLLIAIEENTRQGAGRKRSG
ncbi:MAG: hypothetical protein D6702_00935 [Planctomycetota bacterium]|nr:MAG: hypothetical protein D6702_00935 [Planctomycetota bacterium]